MDVLGDLKRGSLRSSFLQSKTALALYHKENMRSQSYLHFTVGSGFVDTGAMCPFPKCAGLAESEMDCSPIGVTHPYHEM